MAYTVSWEQLAFSDYTWSSVLKLVPKVVTCMFIPTKWDFILKEGDDKVRVERYPPKYVYSMTTAVPFAKDLIKALIVMVEFGGAKILKGDNKNMSMFLDALEEVNSIYNLVSYEEQKTYFMSVKE
jgi:hypothetical protein